MKTKLKQAIGPLGLSVIVFNCTVGGGIFRLPGEIYSIAGNSAPYAYFICAVATILIAMTFIKIGKEETQSGGPYAYVERQLGPLVGFIAGFLLLLLGVFAMASVANALVESIFVLLPSISSFQTKVFLIFSVFSFLGVLNCKGVKVGTNLVTIITLLKLTPLLIFVFYGLSSFQFSEIIQASSSNGSDSSVLRASLLLMFAFMGIESAVTPSGEIQNPSTTLRKGLFIGMLAVLFVYLGIQIVTQGVLGEEILTVKSAPLAFAAEKIMGEFGKKLLLIGATISMFGYLSSMSLGIPRIILKMGQDKVLPTIFGKISEKTQTPNVAIFTLLFIVSIFAVSGSFTRLAIIANLSAISMYILCAIAAIKMDPKKPLIPLLTIFFLGSLLTSLEFSEYIGVLVASALAAGLFFLRKGRRYKEISQF